MTGWKTDPEVNIGWRTPVVFQNRAYGEQAFEIKKMAPGQDKRGQRASVSDRPPARTGTEQGLLRPFCPVFRGMTTWIKSA